MIVEGLSGYHPSDTYHLPWPPVAPCSINTTEAALLGCHIKAQGAKAIRSLTLLQSILHAMPAATAPSCATETCPTCHGFEILELRCPFSVRKRHGRNIHNSCRLRAACEAYLLCSYNCCADHLIGSARVSTPSHQQTIRRTILNSTGQSQNIYAICHNLLVSSP